MFARVQVALGSAWIEGKEGEERVRKGRVEIYPCLGNILENFMKGKGVPYKKIGHFAYTPFWGVRRGKGREN